VFPQQSVVRRVLPHQRPFGYSCKCPEGVSPGISQGLGHFDSTHVCQLIN
jgi:hypothetical protein